MYCIEVMFIESDFDLLWDAWVTLCMWKVCGFEVSFGVGLYFVIFGFIALTSAAVCCNSFASAAVFLVDCFLDLPGHIHCQLRTVAKTLCSVNL